MDSNKYFVTSALPYVNNIPHLGNLVGSSLSADIYARYLRLREKEVMFVCGSDMYGTSSEIKAKQEGLTCEEVCGKYHKIHQEIYDWFNLSFDIYGKTATDTQTKLTHEIFLSLYRNGHIESKIVEQFYCEKCDNFLADRYLEAKCHNKTCNATCKGDQCDTCGDLIDFEKLEEYWCSQCKTKPIKKESKHLFLKLQDMQEDVRNYFIGDKCKINLSDNAYGITKSWLDKGLESRCITRDLKWGTPVPTSDEFPELDEFKNKVFYVWFDAPIGYLSILAHNNENWKYWLKDSNVVQFFAKDNCTFHSIIYPATIMGSGLDYPIVNKISCTEYLTYEGGKFSKSMNLGIFGDHVIRLSNAQSIDADYWRYYLAHIRPESKDSSFDWQQFAQVIKVDLNSKIGNFINRCVSLSKKYLPELKTSFELDDETYNFVVKIINEYASCFDELKIRDGSTYCLVKVAEYGNGYIQGYKVWERLKSDFESGKKYLANALYVAYVIGLLMSPIMPTKSESILKTINVDNKINFSALDVQKKRKY
jgi:methionyl-tRNA synthetase